MMAGSMNVHAQKARNRRMGIKTDSIIQVKDSLVIDSLKLLEERQKIENMEALKEESNIRIISDTIANDVYFENGFYFIPQQSGRVRKLPFKVCTFCYHPNIMEEKNYQELDSFSCTHESEFIVYENRLIEKRRKSVIDMAMKWLYFSRRRRNK